MQDEAEDWRRVLRRNDAGRWTRPSPAQYPHQWNWDSAFISMGWATFDWARACLEVRSLLEAQWTDGLLPHVRYDERFLADYFPGPDRWPGAQGRTRVGGVMTSGITNPPVLALAARRIGRRQPDGDLRRAFWRECLPALTQWLDHLLTRRRLRHGSALPVVVHPWETGWDNSPRWDFLRAAGLRPRRPYERLDTQHVTASQRPGARDYDAYIALAEIIDAGGYDLAKYAPSTPFMVHDVVFDAILLRACADVDDMAAACSLEPPFGEEHRQDLARVFDEVHWDSASESYVDWDCVAQLPIRVATAAGVASLLAGVAGPDRARVVRDAYPGPSAADGKALGVRLPTVAPSEPSFASDLYWRGPSWVNVLWLAHAGSPGDGFDAEALRLARLPGCAEYFDAVSAAPAGVTDFSWTAALALDLLDQPAGT